MSIAAVLFDLDDTLFAHREAVDDAVVATLAAMERRDDPPPVAEEQARWRELEEHHYNRYLARELDYQGQRRARVRSFLAPYGTELDDAAAAAWFEQWVRRYRAAFRLHPDALPCLDALEQRIPGVRFGVITNGDLAFQTAKLEALGIQERFEHVVTSGELGFAKPDPRIFAEAARRFTVRLDACAYVGDRIRTDAVGAATAGMTGIWLDRGAVDVDPADLAEARRLGLPVISGLGDLPGLLLDRTEAA
ncbi:HAD family hydrolase [Amnibacterium sp.]|uniref:HAD family hydrolase n=1 Tax=Amnibacterium sp. TaxID=1872496 RepID=UPI002611D019|nr:HAD-IA family hydrolase [Amnibacterium sp.]MCU1473754.1 hydrolase [Amnibacterium sp.]